MDQRIFAAQVSVRHLRNKLAIERDARRRQTLRRLLDKEKVKLAVLRKALKGAAAKAILIAILPCLMGYLTSTLGLIEQLGSL
jgi:hypothetical protein